VLRAGLERRKYTLQGYTAGCLQYHELISSEVLSQEWGKRKGVGSSHQPMLKRPGVWLERRHEVADSSQQLGVKVHQRLSDLLVQPG
jgi:hypothetical protein